MRSLFHWEGKLSQPCQGNLLRLRMAWPLAAAPLLSKLAR
jgi:hypothetical protein